MAGTQLETVAYIVKEEKIVGVDQIIRPNTLVIEPQEPYPGYHGLFDPKAKKHAPSDIFLMTKKRLDGEQVAHLTRKVKQQSGIEFSAARAGIFFYNDSHPAIRVRGLESYDQIEKLQDWFAEFDVAFAKKEKVDTTGVIKIQKMLYAEEVEEGLYQDLDDEYTRYFEIPFELNWQQFVKITLKIKQNLQQKNYDAALGGIFRRTGLVDVVRIFNSKESSLDEIKKLRALYFAEIKKLG